MSIYDAEQSAHSIFQTDRHRRVLHRAACEEIGLDRHGHNRGRSCRCARRSLVKQARPQRRECAWAATWMKLVCNLGESLQALCAVRTANRYSGSRTCCIRTGQSRVCVAFCIPVCARFGLVRAKPDLDGPKAATPSLRQGKMHHATESFAQQRVLAWPQPGERWTVPAHLQPCDLYNTYTIHTLGR